jgi:hypothetical protein
MTAFIHAESALRMAALSALMSCGAGAAFEAVVSAVEEDLLHDAAATNISITTRLRDFGMFAPVGIVVGDKVRVTL